MPKGSKAKAPRAAAKAKPAAPAAKAPEQPKAAEPASAPVQAGATPPSTVATYYARRSFGYQGLELDRGRVMRIVGLANDEKLVRLGYVALLEKKTTLHECRFCAAKFIDLGTLNAHGDRRHRGPKRHEVDLSEVMKDASPSQIRHIAENANFMADESEGSAERIENEVAPLHLDNTAASRAA